MPQINELLRFWVWFIVLNFVADDIFSEPSQYWIIIEIVIMTISAIMVDWKSIDK